MGTLKLRNRIVMAPLTRSRAGAGDAPQPMNAIYYGQRASAGLIISEASQISQQGKGYACTPGIYTDEQVKGWRLVTDAVHAKGGLIFCQLWHVGRISHPSLQENGALPVAPSAILPAGQAYTESGFQSLVMPRALETEEIPGIVDQYRHAAQCARHAGFDGVEIHGANGYLIDQFLRDKTNKRTDAYGGSIENRLRFMREVVAAVCSVVPSDRVGIRLAPVSGANDIADSDPEALFSAAVSALNPFNLAYLHLVEGFIREPRRENEGFDLHKLRKIFNGLYMANNGYDPALATTTIEHNDADLIAFGRPFISNPDLVERLAAGAPLAHADESTFYGGDERGYIDYPVWDGKAA
jgi:N-ethylmaleimide reductase